MELLIPSIGLVFWSLVCFLILFVILRKYAWRPVLKAVKDRETQIDESIEKAQKAEEEFNEIKKKCESILNESYIEKEAILKEANALKEKMILEAKELAKTEGAKMIEKAKEEIANFQKGIESEMKEEMLKLTIEISKKVLVNEFSAPEIQEKYVKSEISKIKLN